MAKNAEKSLAQLSVKNATSIGSNKGTISTKTFKNGDESVKSNSKATIFKNNNNANGSSAQKLAPDGTEMMEQTQMTNTYLIESTNDGRVAANAPSKNGKIVISGDDILIEYCERLKYTLRQIPDSKLRPAQQAQLIRFITHYVWQMPDKVDVISKKGGVPTRTGQAQTKQVSFWCRI